MRPKHSTGYLTPQLNKTKKSSKVRRAESNENMDIPKDLSDSFFEKIMSCPIKRQLVLHLINSEKDAIEKYKHNLAKEEKSKATNASPLTKLKQNRPCESPSALLRRRALEQQARHVQESDDSSSKSSTSSTSTGQSHASVCPSSVLFNKLLDGVVAYVEIKSKDQDRSSGAKALMRSMGAIVKDKFAKGVTHVVFKDGSFTTYQKAKLMNVHLVSVLWIEAVRKNHMRVPEKLFPALGTEAYDHNVSALCSQLQKDYEDIIRDEIHRSLATGTPLPSTQTLIDRRRTIMTPIASSCKFSQESSQNSEVEKILHPRRMTYNFLSQNDLAGNASSDLMTDDDSDLIDPVINGNILAKNDSVTNLIINSDDENDLRQPENSNMDLTDINSSPLLANSKTKKSKRLSRNNSTNRSKILTPPDSNSGNVKENRTPNVRDESIYYKNTPKLKKSNSDSKIKSKEDNVFNIPDDGFYKRNTRRLYKDGNNTPRDSSSPSASSKTNANTSNTFWAGINKSLMEFVGQSRDIQILSRNACSPPSNQNLKTGDAEKSSSTNMSSLRISSSKETIITTKEGENPCVSSNTNMSLLVLLADCNVGTKTVFSNINNTPTKESSPSKQKKCFSTDQSFSPISSNVVNNLLKTINDISVNEENVTKRRKRRSLEKRTENINSSDPLHATKVNTAESDQSTNPSDDLSEPSPAKKSRSSSRNASPRKKVTETSRKTKRIHNNSKTGNDPVKSPEKNSELKKKVVSRRVSTKKASNSNRSVVTPTDTSNINASGNKLNKTRKLYNPDEWIKEIAVNDEIQRKEKRNEVQKQKSVTDAPARSNVITVTSNILLTAKAKEFMDKNKINITSVINQDREESESESLPPRKRKVKKTKEIVAANSDDDEQQQLAEEFINKTKGETATKKVNEPTCRRKSTRLSLYPRKKLNLRSSTSDTDSDDVIPATPTINRRSTMEFQTKSQMSSLKKLKIDKIKRPSIVCTKLHKEEIQIFNQIVKKLKGFDIEDEVSGKTTHLVAGEAKRTINMLRAMARGCWILKHEWLLRSLEEGKWLPEEDYEETGFSPAVQQCRLQRQAFGPSYTMDVFQDCGPIYIAKSTLPRCSDLRELVSLCKGKVVAIPRNATIVVGEHVHYEGVKCVKETWVLDCITFNKRLPLRKYIITTNKSPFV